MNSFQIVLKSLKQHALSTSVTSLSIALAGGLLMAVWVIKEQASEAFENTNSGFDAVLGARSAKLQLVLNSIFHLEQSPGNLKWTDYEEIANNPSTRLAIPIAVGDNLRGYRIVGTTTNLFTDVEYKPGSKYEIQQPGRIFTTGYREAVVGSFAARKLGLKFGDTFNPYHGLDYNPNERHAETYVVVGILEPSNTPVDRVIWIPISGVQQMEGHAASAGDEISAVLVQLNSVLSGKNLDMMYNMRGNRLTFAWPIGFVMAQLFQKIGWFDRVLALVSYLVAFVACGSILASLYNSMNERRRDIAILRALGAHRRTIFGTIILECMVIAGIGMLGGYLFYQTIVNIVGSVIRSETGIVIDALAFHPVLIIAPLALIALSAIAGLVPAFKAYRTPVAENLIPVA